VAHKAQFDCSVLVESIENRMLHCDDGDTETRLRRLRTALRDPRRWTCTWQRSVVQGSRVGARRLADYRLPTVYEAVTETPLSGHHNARTDAYACAVILCRLLECDDLAVKRAFCAVLGCDDRAVARALARTRVHPK
jgi:DNA polymerase III epsilon subunit-like protein